jgi:spore maturation protein A
MLNYVWIALILVGIAVAVGNDVSDELRNPYRNGVPVDVRVEFRGPADQTAGMREGEMVMDAAAYNALYGSTDARGLVRQRVRVGAGEEGFSSLLMDVDEHAPARWREMARAAASKGQLSAIVQSFVPGGDGNSVTLRIVFEPIKFVRLKAVTQAALDYAGIAVNIAIGLIGIMALWLGVMKVADDAGLLAVLTRFLTPVTRRLFPDVPSQHPAVGAMIMNIAANMLGLSNAATPMGLKAMEELNKLNPKPGTATNAMVTFLAINTGGLILIPATAIAVRAAAGSSNPGIIIGTSIVGASCATIAGVAASKLLQRFPRYRKAMEVGHE